MTVKGVFVTFSSVVGWTSDRVSYTVQVAMLSRPFWVFSSQDWERRRYSQSALTEKLTWQGSESTIRLRDSTITKANIKARTRSRNGQKRCLIRALLYVFPSHQGEQNPEQATPVNHPSCRPVTSSPCPANKIFQNVELNSTSSSCPQGPPRGGRHTYTTRARLAVAEQASNARRSCSRSRLARVDHALTRPHAGLGLLGGIHGARARV